MIATRCAILPAISRKTALTGDDGWAMVTGFGAALSQAEGMERLSLDTEAPGLIAFGVKYAGEPRHLVERLGLLFPQKYSVQEKNLPSGAAEVILSREGS